MTLSINGKTYEAGEFTAYVEKLEKENTEMKADNDARKFAMAMSEKVEKQLQKENAELKTNFKIAKDNEYEYSNLLTKAKEIIKDLLNLPFASNEEVFADVGSHLYKAEQFLSEVGK